MWIVWGSAFGLVHDYLFGPSWLRGVVFAGAAALIVMFIIAPLTGSGSVRADARPSKEGG